MLVTWESLAAENRRWPKQPSDHGYVLNDSNAARLNRNEQIRERIRELVEALADKMIVTREDLDHFYQSLTAQDFTYTPN